MDKQQQSRLNELARNFDCIKVRKQLIAEFGDSKSSFTGVNEDGETVTLHISKNGIIVETFQSNGWVRKNYYDAEGNAEGEGYSGRWNG